MSSELERNILTYLLTRPDERFTLDEIMTGTDTHDSWKTKRILRDLAVSKTISSIPVMTDNGYRYGYRAFSGTAGPTKVIP